MCNLRRTRDAIPVSVSLGASPLIGVRAITLVANYLSMKEQASYDDARS